MFFNSVEFLLFLPLVIIGYYLIPFKYRWILLLAASYYFYMCWRVEYIVLIMASTIIDYISGIQIEKSSSTNRKRWFLGLSLITNLGLLFSFKYFNFVANSANQILETVNITRQIPSLKVLLPVGISFYTFQTLSYTIDVFYGKAKAEKHLGYFALYVSFFPQLVAGPIERFTRLSPQLKTPHSFSYENLANGLRLILFGLFIKMVVADNVSVYVDQIYANPEQYNSISILTGLFFYSFQIYSDFFGYSTIAIGAALIMGIHLMDNFKTPYLAKSAREFWDRWHISLSTWFRSYLYFPLGGNRVSKQRWVLNIMIVFTVSGLWHGANWTYIIWGAIWGALFISEHYINKIFKIQPTQKEFSVKHLLLSTKMIFAATVIFVFFRSQSFNDAIFLFKSIARNTNLNDEFAVSPKTWIFLGIFILLDILLYNKRFDQYMGSKNSVFRWIVYAILLFAIIVFAGVDNFPFIYFQF